MTATTIEQPTILDCGHMPSEHSSITTGYGRDADGKTHCYACCADGDRKRMIEDGKITLYLYDDEPLGTRAPGQHTNRTTARVTNWPNSLSFPVRHLTKGRHNIAQVRYDVDFVGPDGFWWHGTQYGDWTQIVHCKRTKRVA